MPKWTQQQQDAIDASGRSIIVSAAAGSGKTAVLIERLIRIISDTEKKTEVEKMVVVTFTKAAAAEMKQRLSAALLKKISQEPSNGWLARQHAMLGMASISTIHSFCFNLIRDNITKLSLSADFRILEETEQKLFSDTVLKSYIDELYDTNPSDIKLLCDNFCGNNDTPLLSLLPALYTDISSIPFYEKKFSEFIKLYDNDFYTEKYLDDLKLRLESYENALSDLISIADGMDEKKLSEVLDDDMNILKKSLELLEKSSFKDMAEYISSVKYKNFPAAKKDVVYPEEREYIKIKRTEIKDAVREIPKQKSIILNADDDLKRHKEIMKVLSKMILEYDKRLYEYKVQKNAVGFDDAEQLVLKLLGDCDEDGNIIKTPLGEEISKNYDIIMVDEFQDSNDRQDMIFRLLSRNGTPEKYGENLFFVGDVKQSIYRFRQANPDNFIGVLKKFVPYDKNDSQNAYIKLNRNFRSSPQVINFVNFVFKNIMSEKAGDINYDEDEFLVNGMEFFENNRDTHIMLIDKSDKQEDTEAVCIASKIRKMIDDGELVSDGKGGVRKCEMRDFCILMRNKKYNEIYTQALEKYDLIASCEDVSGYLRSREISILLNILRVINNPLLDIPVASVLMSPMFMLSADEMAQIRLVDRKGKLYANISKILGKNDQPPLVSQDTLIYKKTETFYNLISELRLISSFYTLPEIIQIIYDRTDFTSVIGLYKDADKKRANLRMLLEYANSYESSSGGGIGGFLRYIDRISESKGDFKSIGGNSGIQNSVSIKTMHKSKGLEFPFVFIAQTDTQFSTLDDKKPYQFSPKMGIGFRLQNKEKFERFKTIPYEVINKYNKNKNLSEEMRILYVALTRAKERLFITLDISDTNKKKAEDFAADIYKNSGITPSLAGSVKSMNDWLLMNLISHRKAAPLREELGVYECFRYDDDFPLSFEHAAPYEEYQSIRDENQKEQPEFDSSAVQLLYDNFAFKYDSTLTKAIAKLSVSDISKNDETQLLLLKRPDFASDDGELSPAEKGTALHGFLQFADFEKLSQDFEAEKERMLKYGYITGKQAKAVKKEDVDAFLNSNLYREIQNAEKVIRERKFLISIDDLEFEGELAERYKGTDGMINGIMDMVIEKKDEVILVDYKTDKVQNANILADRYRMQILLYKKALEKIQSKPVKSAIIYSFYKKTEVVVF